MNTKTGPTSLERRYRRLLAWYPRAWRRQNEEEILAVLMTCAQDGQTRPGLATSADLIRSALMTRLQPAGGRAPRSVFLAAELMCLGALATAASGLVVLATIASVKTAVLHRYPDLSSAQWHAVMVHMTVEEIGAPIVAIVWLWMAWANVRGHDWARPAFMSLFFLSTVSVLAGLGEGAVTYAPVDLIAGGVVWLIGLGAMFCIFSKQAGPYYQHRTRRPPLVHPAG